MLFKYNYLFSSPVEAVHGVMWSKNRSDFIKIFSISLFESLNRQRFLISREIETHDFDGMELKFTSFPIRNLVDFKENNTVVSGVHGDIWNVLSEMLNFKLRSIRINQYEYGSELENGSWTGLIGYIYRNETDIIPRNVMFPSRLTAQDFTLATWQTAYRFYMKKHLEYHRAWMTELFERDLWFSIIGIFFALTFASFSTHALNFRDQNTEDSITSLRDHFFYIYSIFCNQGWMPRQLETRSKILLLSTRVFAWVLIIAFSSKLISHIAEAKFTSPFNDLESFYINTDYKLVVQPNSFVHSIFKKRYKPIHKTIDDAGRLIQKDFSEAQKKVCSGKYVHLDLQDLVEANMRQPCEITYVGKPYISTGIAAGVIRGFKYRKTIDLGILKLREYGIMQRIKFRWLKKTKAITSSHSSPKPPKPINLEHVSIIFAMLGCAIILSLLILAIEKITYIWFM